MGRKILVIGGNRFFGKRLVEKLIINGDSVTLLNRGHMTDGFGEKVQRLVCDRDDAVQLKKLTQHKSWDVVYDQVCFDVHQARSAVEIFSGQTKKFIFTSTLSVYDLAPQAGLHEEAFNPWTYQYDKIVSREEAYGEAKRQCEAIFFKQNIMPVTAVRLPIVIGPDDYTERLKFYVDKIKNGEPVFFPNPQALISFIHAGDAADGLFLLGNISFTGPVNMASATAIRLFDLIKFIELAVGKKAVIYTQAQAPSAEKSPYGIEKDWSVNIDRALALGFKPHEISEWIVAVIKNYL